MDLRRRDTLMFLVASCVTPVAARAQQGGKVYRLAWLSGTPIVPSAVWSEFVAAMRDLGLIEGKNYTVENLRYEGRGERLPALAAEAVERKFDLIICAGTPPTVAAQRATTTIPIVFYFVGDPVDAGLVATLARPGANIAGLGGRYGRLRQDARAANGDGAKGTAHRDHGQFDVLAARGLRCGCRVGRTKDQVGAGARRAALTRGHRRRLRDDCSRQGRCAAHPRSAVSGRSGHTVGEDDHRAPVAHDGPLRRRCPRRRLVRYGSKLVDDVRRVPHYVDRILKGASPATLPVEQPSRFYLTINLKTAKAIGLTVPTSLLQRTDQVIE